jgi:hypothetical protein
VCGTDQLSESARFSVHGDDHALNEELVAAFGSWSGILLHWLEEHCLRAESECQLCVMTTKTGVGVGAPWPELGVPLPCRRRALLAVGQGRVRRWREKDAGGVLTLYLDCLSRLDSTAVWTDAVLLWGCGFDLVDYGLGVVV